MSQRSLPLVTDRVAMYLDGAPAGRLAVRRAAGLAGRLHADLIAIVPSRAALDALAVDARRDLRDALDTSRDLGAQVVTLGDGALDEELAAAARKVGATHLFLPSPRSTVLARLAGPSLVDRLGRSLGDVDIHLFGPGD